MFRLFIVFFLSLQISFFLQAQNLVHNPGFENVECLTESYCGAQQYEVKLIADYWRSATQGSPDIFSPCNDVFDPLDSTIVWCDGWGVPYNWLGYKFARSGQNYGGYFSGVIYFKDSIIPDRKEFLTGSLKEPLRSGRKYCTGLYITPAMTYLVNNNKKSFFYYVSNQIGIYFSNSRLFVSTYGTPPVTPQVVLKSDIYQYIADTSGWERLYAPYIATGGEQYLTIGNFTPRAQMIMHLVTNMSQAFIDSSGGEYGACIHYIDDVEVIEIPELEAKADTNTIYKGNTAWLFSPTQAEEYTWFAGDTLNKIGSGDSLWVSPTETTTYYLKALQCKLTTYDTVTVTVLPAPLIPVNVSVVNTLTNTEFTIKYTGDSRPELLVELFNSVGQIVGSYSITETVSIGVSDLAAGIYYCRIRKDNVPVFTQKIVIAK